ncbi:rhamnogalacturonan acetylesterase [Streptomyces aidingensis]|uniref:Lysophospholipase L1 n=1 Tax=Streptomyces aidingensis TaxID=910347 RepID=A0A1I1Q7B2_9ACTN|nr:rhamnogalacturonan acetylesterase [Streptomyces aidingensis]SFD15103.1 Lysophospholipase L1 [Streptomyces aidingensis]
MADAGHVAGSAPGGAGAPFRIFIAGDSTAAVYEARMAPSAGWGQALPVFTAPHVTVVNRALSGASTRSYDQAGLLAAILRDIAPGDRLLISFGHNDQTLDDHWGGTQPYSSYQAFLRRYLAGARQRGAHPVLVTPVERRCFRRDGTPFLSLGEYPAAMAALAARERVPLVDLSAASAERWARLGPEGTKDCFLWLEPGEHRHFPFGASDNTHFQARGAIEAARLVATALAKDRILPDGAFTGLDRPVREDELVWPPRAPSPG